MGVARSVEILNMKTLVASVLMCCLGSVVAAPIRDCQPGRYWDQAMEKCHICLELCRPNGDTLNECEVKCGKAYLPTTTPVPTSSSLLPSPVSTTPALTVGTRQSLWVFTIPIAIVLVVLLIVLVIVAVRCLCWERVTKCFHRHCAACSARRAGRHTWDCMHQPQTPAAGYLPCQPAPAEAIPLTEFPLRNDQAGQGQRETDNLTGAHNVQPRQEETEQESHPSSAHRLVTSRQLSEDGSASCETHIKSRYSS